MLKDSLMRQVSKEHKDEEKQKKLHRKYKKEHLPDQAIIIEKNNMTKFLLTLSGNIIRITAQIIILILAALGLIALVYPQCRFQLLDIVTHTIDQLIQLVL